MNGQQNITLTLDELEIGSKQDDDFLWQAHQLVKLGCRLNYPESTSIEQINEQLLRFSKFVALYFKNQLSSREEIFSALKKFFPQKEVMGPDGEMAVTGITDDQQLIYLLHPENLCMRFRDLLEQREHDIENYPVFAKLLRDYVVNTIFRSLVDEKRKRLDCLANNEVKMDAGDAKGNSEVSSKNLKLEAFDKFYAESVFKDHSVNISKALSNIQAFHFIPSRKTPLKILYDMLLPTALLLGVYHITNMAADPRQSAKSMGHLVNVTTFAIGAMTTRYGNKLLNRISIPGFGNLPKKLVFQTAILMLRSLYEGFEMFGYYPIPRGLKISITGKILTYFILDHMLSSIVTLYSHSNLTPQSIPLDDKRRLTEGSDKFVRMSEGVDLDKIIALKVQDNKDDQVVITVVPDNKVDQVAITVVPDNKVDRRIVVPIADEGQPFVNFWLPAPDKKPASVNDTGNHPKSCLQKLCSFFYSSTPPVNTQALARANKTNHRKHLRRRKLTAKTTMTL